MVGLVISGKSSARGISSFQALTLTLSGRLGTGNIVGVAAAIGFGGPGAVFWMWIVAFLGASTAFVETTLGQIYKEEDEGQYRGGPAYYLEKATGKKWIGISFALITIIAVGILYPSVQANAISTAAELSLGEMGSVTTIFGDLSISRTLVGLVVVILVGTVIFGGIKRIAHVAQVVVPFMAITYVIIAITVIIPNIGELPRIIGMIVGDAFTPIAGFGASVGWGIRRGIFSNEAGLGTSCHASSAAEVQHPAQQGLIQALSVYIDTMIVCSATAFMILITDSYNVELNTGEFVVQNLSASTNANGATYTLSAINSVLPEFGSQIVTLALFFFAFTTILAYYYIAESNITYIRRYFKMKWSMRALKSLVLVSAMYGSIKAPELAWGLSDLGTGMIAWLNLLGILGIFFLSDPALKALRDYEAQRQNGTANFTFNPAKLGIKNADYWEARSDELQ